MAKYQRVDVVLCGPRSNLVFETSAFDLGVFVYTKKLIMSVQIFVHFHNNEKVQNLSLTRQSPVFI
jgi:hypothetical protein